MGVVSYTACHAVAKKIIVLDYKSISYEMLLSLAAIMLALTTGYFLIKRAETPSRSDK